MSRELRARLGPLREREFGLLFFATAASLFGDQLVPIALSFAVLQITGSVGALGLVLAAGWLPAVLLLLLGGVLADRFSRRRLMIAADLARVTSQGTAAVLVLNGNAEVWHLIVLQLVHGAAASLFDPAFSGLIPQTVSPERLQQANALRVLARSVAMLAGPLVAGILVATAGPGWALGVDAATFAISAGLLALMSTPALAIRAEIPSILSQLAEGWREFTARTWLWTMVVQHSLFHLLVVAPVLTLGVVLADRELGGAEAWAAILVAFGAGSLVGGTWGLRIRPERPLVAATVALTGVAPHIVLLAASAPLPAIVAAAPLGGFGMAVFATLWDTTLQREIPERVLSRVSSYDWLGSIATFPLGYALAGPLAIAFGVHGALWLAATVAVATCTIVIVIPSVRAIRSEPVLA